MKGIFNIIGGREISLLVSFFFNKLSTAVLLITIPYFLDTEERLYIKLTYQCNNEMKHRREAYSSVEIADFKVQPIAWSVVWLTLLELLHQLSIKICSKKSNWDTYLSQGHILENLICLSSLFRLWHFIAQRLGILHRKQRENEYYLPKRGSFWPLTQDD